MVVAATTTTTAISDVATRVVSNIMTAMVTSSGDWRAYTASATDGVNALCPFVVPAFGLEPVGVRHTQARSYAISIIINVLYKRRHVAAISCQAVCFMDFLCRNLIDK